MCADYGNLRATVEGSRRRRHRHLPLRDGRQFSFPISPWVSNLRPNCERTNKLVDVHLMVENPASRLNFFASAGGHHLYPSESERYVVKTLAAIKSSQSRYRRELRLLYLPRSEEMLNLCDT